MVSEANGRATFTEKEIEVLTLLRKGPADLSIRTGSFLKRPLIGEPFELRLVDRVIAKRLARAGYVVMDLGGQVRLTPKAMDAIRLGEAG